jgi:histidinol-phosphatase (PHP family)
MRENEIGEYVDTLCALREKYKDKITLHIGFEVEYYPNTWEKSLSHWREYGIEYLILGQHFAGLEEDGISSIFVPTENEDSLKTYVSLVNAGIKTGKISYLAHPDAINFRGDSEFYKREMRKIIECAIEHDVPIEYNLLGISKKRNYPNREFWSLAKEYKPKIILGCDAHQTEDVANPETVEIGRRHLSELGLTDIIEKLHFKPL